MKSYFRKWSVMRAIRLAIGIFIMAYGFQDGVWQIVVLGALFTAMPVFNVGCGASGSCDAPRSAGHRRDGRTTYEEI